VAVVQLRELAQLLSHSDEWDRDASENFYYQWIADQFTIVMGGSPLPVLRLPSAAVVREFRDALAEALRYADA
jgi:hypothetical protein